MGSARQGGRLSSRQGEGTEQGRGRGEARLDSRDRTGQEETPASAPQGPALTHCPRRDPHSSSRAGPTLLSPARAWALWGSEPRTAGVASEPQARAWAGLLCAHCAAEATLRFKRAAPSARLAALTRVGNPPLGREGCRAGLRPPSGPGRPGLTRLRGRSAPGPGEARSGSGKADQIHTSQATGRSEEVFLLDTGWNRKGSPDRSEWELLCPKATPSQSAGSPRPGHRLRWARGSGLPLLPSAVT